MAKKVYTNPESGTPLMSTISTGCKTPMLEIKFSNLVKPFYYPNSPTVPRYSVTLVFDPEIHKDFLYAMQILEKNEGVDTIIKNDTKRSKSGITMTGKLNIKLQSKDPIPVYVKEKFDDEKEELIELEDELAKGEKVVVHYEILRYTKKNTMKTEHGISFKPISIFYYPNERTEKNKEENGDC